MLHDENMKQKISKDCNHAGLRSALNWLDMHEDTDYVPKDQTHDPSPLRIMILTSCLKLGIAQADDFASGWSAQPKRASRLWNLAFPHFAIRLR